MKIAFCCTQTDAGPWVAALRAALPQACLEVWTDQVADRESLKATGPAGIAVVWNPPQAFIDAHPHLHTIFNIGAGVDGLMKLRIPRRANVIRIDDGGMAVQMAEYVCHAVIRHFRELDLYETGMATGQWLLRPPRHRHDFPVGVMGLGFLGERVARTLAHFDFTVNGWSRSPKKLAGVRCFSGEAGFGDFLSSTRILVCLLPLTQATQDIMCRDTLARLQRGAYVINIARGAHLVEQDMLDLINDGHIAGAMLDVFRTEPLPATHPFRHHPRIALTPHTAARTLLEETVAQISQKIQALALGGKVKGQVDLRQGY